MIITQEEILERKISKIINREREIQLFFRTLGVQGALGGKLVWSFRVVEYLFVGVT